MRSAWLATVGLLLLGGWVGWNVLGLMCAETDSPGTETYCGGGGWEASGLAFGGLFAFAMVVPATAVLLRRKRLFWSALVAAVLLASLNFVLSVIFGSN
jgi:hypothetical protein